MPRHRRARSPSDYVFWATVAVLTAAAVWSILNGALA